MNSTYTKTIMLFVGIILWASIGIACTPQAEPAPIVEVTSEQEYPEIEVPVELPESDWRSGLCPERLSDEVEYKVVFGLVEQEGDYLIQTGKYTNLLDQEFDIVVKGSSKEVIQRFTDEIRVCMELTLITEESPSLSVVPDLLASEPLDDKDILLENTENLVIFIAPSASNFELYPDDYRDGYIWFYVIDPQISKNVIHDFTVHCKNWARVTVGMGSAGCIESTLYVIFNPENTFVTTPQKILANGSVSYEYTPPAVKRVTYDLSIIGDCTGSYKYSVNGTVWNFGENAPTPSGSGTPCPTPKPTPTSTSIP